MSVLILLYSCCLLPAACSDLFGLKHFAANYTTLQFAPAMGSYLLATEVTGWLYDRAAEAHGDIHQVRCSWLMVL
jgi:hypothetical protein